MSPRRLVALFCAVALSGLALGVLVTVASRHPRQVTPVRQDRPGPVLLVPGYGGGRAALNALAARLTAAGRDATVVPLPGDGTGDLRAQARLLGGAARSALSRSGAGSVDVIGYSAGGVVSRLWVRSYGGAAVARRVITLGSPHHGTSLAGLASVFATDSCPLACQQLSPGSDLLSALNAGDETPDGPQWVAVWSADDEVVTPPDSARLAGAVDLELQDICGGLRVEHADLPTDSLVQGIVLAELTATPVVTPSAADCRRLSG